MSVYTWFKTNSLSLPPVFELDGRIVQGVGPYFPHNRDVAEWVYYTTEMEEDGCIFRFFVVLTPKDLELNKNEATLLNLAQAKMDILKLSMSVHITEHTEDRDAYHEKHPTNWGWSEEEDGTEETTT